MLLRDVCQVWLLLEVWVCAKILPLQFTGDEKWLPVWPGPWFFDLACSIVSDLEEEQLIRTIVSPWIVAQSAIIIAPNTAF